jgi:hypothetical protein
MCASFINRHRLAKRRAARQHGKQRQQQDRDHSRRNELGLS